MGLGARAQTRPGRGFLLQNGSKVAFPAPWGSLKGSSKEETLNKEETLKIRFKETFQTENLNQLDTPREAAPAADSMGLRPARRGMGGF